ncbi:glycosyltransferase family 4 protein [Pseudomonas aeruginosa]
MHSKSVESLSLTRAGFIEYFLVATKLVHALTAIAPALFLLYYPGLVPVELRSNMLGLLLFFGALTVIMFQALDVYSDDIFSNRLRFRIMFFAWASAFCLLLFMYQGLGLFPYLSSKLVIFWFTGSLLLFGVQRLLVLRLPYSPWPTTSGGKTRQYHLLRSLAARGHRITVLLHSKQPVSAEDRQALEPFLERLVVLPRRPLRSLSTLLAALFAPYPLLASVNGLSAELQRTATELLREPWDVVQVEHSYSFQPYERPLRDAGQPFVLTEHNVESSLGAATYDRLPGWALPFVRYDQWRYRRWERRVMSQAAAVVAVTEKDARQLSAMLGRPVPVVVNGVDCEHFAAARPTPEAQRVLFLGNYEYAPNVDAVEWMLDEILPRVWAHCPEARMSVCGYALPAEWAQRWSDPRIEWQGFVPDLLQLQSSSSVFLAALRHGGGSKLKVLEALAAGLPLASTAQGVSGLELRDGEDYLGGESAEQLANAVVRLLQDPAQARALGENGRAYVRRAHDWSVAASQLEQVYAGLAEGAPACA